jgi:AAA15 family ATPase/GTPase
VNLIERVEINYFRSVYSVSLKKLSDLNVFIGANDAGKSNILRALNLFFNNESGYDEELQFLQDVTHLRQEEARDAKGRLTIWIKVHFNNVEKWKTLPRRFFIKKSWNRYSDEPEVSSDVNNKQSLTKFQNKIQFHYVPAVKERDIFSDYLQLLYETVSSREDIEFSGPAEALSTAVNKSIVDLTDNIKTALAVTSNIQIPNDLESIFERLEFFTQQDAFRVPLSRRGDGLQVRHIPHILQYISTRNRGLNVWAYEEPENSLEMSNAFALAMEFEKEFSVANQIFITSHSPAFYSLDSENTRHYLVKKSGIESAGRTSSVTSVEDLESAKIADVELGVAQLVAQRSQDAFEEIERLRSKNEQLTAVSRPVVLTEGKTDAILLTAAWTKLFPDQPSPFEIASCDLGGADGAQENAGADELKKILESTTKNQNPVRIGVFDRDKKGSECFENLKKHQSYKGASDSKINQNKLSGAVRLPAVQWGSPYDRYLDDATCVEVMFPFAELSSDDVEFVFYMGNKKLTKAKAEEWIKHFEDSPDLFDDVPFRAVAKFKQKTELANKLAACAAEKFQGFIPIFGAIEELLQGMKPAIVATIGFPPTGVVVAEVVDAGIAG